MESLLILQETITLLIVKDKNRKSE